VLRLPVAAPGLIMVRATFPEATPVDVATERYAREEVEIAGVTIPRGALVLVAIVSANADGTRFPEPERMDVSRAENRHLAFGLGPHYCLGVHLARAEMRCMIDASLDFLPPGARYRPDLVQWQRMMFFRRPQNLPVDFGG